jgi:hypothetical protein
MNGVQNFVYNCGTLFLFQACDDYLPLARTSNDPQIQSLYRRKLKKTQRNLSQHHDQLSSENMKYRHFSSEDSLCGLGLEIAREVSQLK